MLFLVPGALQRISNPCTKTCPVLLSIHANACSTTIVAPTRKPVLCVGVFVPERHCNFQSEFRHGCDDAVPRRRPIMFYIEAKHSVQIALEERRKVIRRRRRGVVGGGRNAGGIPRYRWGLRGGWWRELVTPPRTCILLLEAVKCKGMTTVIWSRAVDKQLSRIPELIVRKFRIWVAFVEESGIREVRKHKGFHDEPLKGQRQGAEIRASERRLPGDLRRTRDRQVGVDRSRGGEQT